MRPRKPTARRRRGTPAGTSRWHLFAMGAFSVFLLGTFLLGNLATAPVVVADVRLAPTLGHGHAGDASTIAGELAAQLRPEPTTPDPAAAEWMDRLALLKQAEITFDQSESDGPVARIQWKASAMRNGGLNSQAEFANVAHAFAEEVSARARREAATMHTASSKLLQETTAAIESLEQGLEQLLESKLSTESNVFPISYWTESSPPSRQASRPVIRDNGGRQQPPGLLINDFARELESVQDAERLREMKMRLISERSQLLQDKTERHPDVIRKDAQIEYVQQRLDSLPVVPLESQQTGPRLQDVSARMNGDSEVTSQRLEELISQLQTLQQGRESLFAEWRQRMTTLQQLREARNEQLQAERAALENCIDLTQAELATVENVRLSREIVPSRWAMIAGMLVFGSVVAGGSLAGWGKRCASTFASVDDVRKTAGIPLMGTLTGTEADVMPRAARSRKMFRLASFACEMFLLVTVLWIAVLAIADVEYRGLLTESPLSALLETCSRSWQLLLG